jgi:SAM-dependent methyltransferase
MSQQSATGFFDTWQTYRKVVAANYMYHIEIAADIERLLQAQSGGRGFSILDLGCGDAATLAPLLATMPVRHYRGVDLSETALALAEANLAPLSCTVELTRRDILAALESETAPYDIIYSSFALHHLQTDQKAAFFNLVAQRLEPNGVLLLTDVVREDHENLPVYLNHYCDRILKDWGGLSGEEKAAICDHIQNNDRPETFGALQALAHAAGLTDAAAVARYGWHRVMRFRRLS